MLTKKDRQALLEDFSKIFVTKEEMTLALSELKNEMFNRFDVIIGELQAMREEITLTVYRVAEHSDQLELHESRLRTVETKNLTSD